MSLMQLFLRLMIDPARPDSRRRKKDERGFTLTELMVVIFIIGLLATVVLINVLPSQDKAMVTKAKADIATLESALEQYRLRARARERERGEKPRRACPDDGDGQPGLQVLLDILLPALVRQPRAGLGGD